jgi:outer membrane protein
MRRILLLLTITCLYQNLFAQQKWNLQTVMQHAMQNNILVKQNMLQQKLASVTTKQSKDALQPVLNFNGNVGLNAGNNQDPTTFTRITQSYLNSGFQLQTSADIFNFYSKKNTIKANELEEKASAANVEKTQNDIALQAANAYLQILLNKSQEDIAAVQIQQTQAQLNTTRKFVNAGAQPELNATQIEAQLAQDSVNYLNTKTNTAIALLNLKNLMNIDAGAPFEVDIPAVDKIPVEPIASLQPEFVYNTALQNMPQQKFNEFKYQAALKNKQVAKAGYYPSLSAFASLGTSYIAANTPAFAPVFNGFAPSGDKVNISGTDYFIQSPSFNLQRNGTNKSRSFFTQVDNNLQRGIGLSVRIPIHTAGANRASMARAQLSIEQFKLQKEQDNQKLKQDIYQAYTGAVMAYDRFNSSRKVVEVNEQSLNFATKRYNIGMLGILDLITTQNNLLRAKLQYAQNQFEYVFRMKVLEFYKGQGLKL